MPNSFPCLPVTLLFNDHYYDGPLSGVCEYQNEKLYFWCVEELMFKYAETDPQIIAMLEEGEEPYQMHRCRVFSLFKLPDEIMEIINFNHELFEKLKVSKNEKWSEEYSKNSKQLPDYFTSQLEFFKVTWQYCVGYTTEDVWNRDTYNKKRYNLDG
jgi:hypothetical protein